MPYASKDDRAERDHARYAKKHKTLSEAWLVACDLEDENDDGKADLLQAGWYTPDGRFHVKSIRNEQGISYREAATFQSDVYYACATMQRKLDATKQPRTIFIWYAGANYDWDQLAGNMEGISDRERYVLAHMGKKSYGKVRDKDFCDNVTFLDTKQQLYQVSRTARALTMKRLKTDENGMLVMHEEKPIVLQQLVNHDLFGLTASSFVKAIEDVVAPNLETYFPFISRAFFDAQLDIVRAGKLVRGKFVEAGYTPDDIATYNMAELRLLALEGMTFQKMCDLVGLSPASLAGPAPLAKAALKKYGAMQHIRRDDYDEAEFKEGSVYHAIKSAYFAGRIELAGIGHIDTLYESDINSAYPTAIADLPCGKHGYYKELDQEQAEQYCIDHLHSDTLAVYHVRWGPSKGHKLSLSCGWGPFPARSKTGQVSFPLHAESWVHHAELATYLRYRPDSTWPDVMLLGAVVWIPKPCECPKPFSFIHELYALRMQFKKNGQGEQLIIKLCMNSAYGALAQQCGEYTLIAEDGSKTYHSPKTQNLLLAGAITSFCRAKILKELLLHGDTIIGVATDAIFSTEPMTDLVLSDSLGDWSQTIYYDNEIVMPGIRSWESSEENGKQKGPGYKCRGIAKDQIGGFFGDVKQARMIGIIQVAVKNRVYIGLLQATDKTGKFVRDDWGHIIDDIKEIDISSTVLRSKRDITRIIHVYDGGFTSYAPTMNIPVGDMDWLIEGVFEWYEQHDIALERSAMRT